MLKGLIFLTASLIAACSQAGRHAHLEGLGETGRPALHAIHDQQLRVMMARMNALLQERFMTETQLDSERRKYAQRITEIARGLANTIDMIIDKMPTLALTDSEQAAFLAWAKKLREQAEQLYEQAGHNRLEDVDASLREMKSTCTSCHALFREG